MTDDKIIGAHIRRIVWDDPRLPSRFWSKVMPEPNSGCWLWLGPGDSYAKLWIDGAMRPMHRHMLELLGHKLTPGIVARHRCDVMSCVNPDHLLPGTQADNMHDRDRRGRNFLSQKTHCPAGHPYAEFARIRAGARHCILCDREHSRRQVRKTNLNPRVFHCSLCGEAGHTKRLCAAVRAAADGEVVELSEVRS